MGKWLNAQKLNWMKDVVCCPWNLSAGSLQAGNLINVGS
uniref:Uncharacterized protein n=1 Tax=Rhizophora mucronata TaxID=61149 RepID=A0A2P2QC16_RHIMU